MKRRLALLVVAVQALLACGGPAERSSGGPPPSPSPSPVTPVTIEAPRATEAAPAPAENVPDAGGPRVFPVPPGAFVLETTAEECRGREAWAAARARARQRLREHAFGAAVAAMRNAAVRSSEHAELARMEAERFEWLADVFRLLEQRGVTLLGRAERVFAAPEELVPRRSPRASADPAPSGSGRFIEAEALDVWARLPDGWVLVAAPWRAPDFTVGDPWAIEGWVLSSEVTERPSRPRAMDVGRPLRILRPNRWGSVRLLPSDLGDANGRACVECGVVGVQRQDESLDVGCQPLQDLCGGPGLTDERPARIDVMETMEATGCAHCAGVTRNVPAIGDHCHAPAPGYTWQCSADGRRLECAPSAAARADALVREPQLAQPVR